MRLDRPWLIVAGLCCILCPSLGMLAAVYYNRSGPPVSVLQLTERELRLPSSEDEAEKHTALTFGLIWRVEGMEHSDFMAQQPSLTPVSWVTREKRAELGLRSQEDISWRSSVPAFLVLEFSGRAYGRAISQVCRLGNTEACIRVRNIESRLYVIDAGTNFEALRDKYPNTGVYAIVRGTVKFNATRNDADASAAIGGMDVETVQAVEPSRSAKSSSGEMSWHQALSGRPFKAEIAFGRRNEPWNLSVSSRADAIAPPPEPPKYQNDGRIEIKPD